MLRGRGVLSKRALFAREAVIDILTSAAVLAEAPVTARELARSTVLAAGRAQFCAVGARDAEAAVLGEGRRRVVRKSGVKEYNEGARKLVATTLKVMGASMHVSCNFVFEEQQRH